MEHHNTYRVQLGKAYPSLGHALWEPDPRELGHPRESGPLNPRESGPPDPQESDPPDPQESGPSSQYPVVGVGDVGFIREGRFKRLFNVLLPADHPFHGERYDVPDGYEQLQLHPTMIDCGTLKPNDFFSAGIKILSGGLKVLAPG